MKITALAFLSLLGVAACDAKSAPAAAPPQTTAATTVAQPTPKLVAAVPSVKAAAEAAAAAQPAAEPPPIAAGTKMKCPVSGDEFTVKATTQQVVHAGKRYAFCCPDCQPEFVKNPAKFAKN